MARPKDSGRPSANADDSLKATAWRCAWRCTASSSNLGLIKEIMAVANQANVGVCWNSNASDVVGGTIKPNFDLVKNKLGRTAHINELYSGYPYRELFSLLRSAGFEGYCLAECQKTSDPLHVMRYYRALWQELSGSNSKTA